MYRHASILAHPFSALAEQTPLALSNVAIPTSGFAGVQGAEIESADYSRINATLY